MKKIVILLLSISFLSSCVEEKREDRIPIVEEDAIPVELDNSSSDVTVSKFKIWSSKEIKLPIGEIIEMDCENCKVIDKKSDISNNVILIKRPNGVCVMKTDINEDLFILLEIGDKIIE